MQKQEYTIPQMVDDVRSGKMPRRRFFKALTAMGISTAGIGAIAAAASRSFSSQPVPQVSVQERPERQFQLHDQHLANQSQRNSAQLQNDYAENAVVEDSMYPHPFVGRAAIMERKNVGMSAIPDLKINITNRVVHGNQISAEWVATGTHTGDLPGMAATGRPFTLRGVTVTIRQNDKIVREAIYYDVKHLHRQIGPS